MYRHHAPYNPVDQQMEMYLIAQSNHRVQLPALDSVIDIAEGEAIQTEISRKFTPKSLHTLLQESGFTAEEHFQPENGYFSLVLARP